VTYLTILRRYPVKRPSSAPATGRLLYQHLMNKLGDPARANHNIWYAGEEAKLKSPSEFAFRGANPKGKTHELKSLSGKDITEGKTAQRTEKGTVLYTFTGSEGPVLVSDLSDSAREELGIPASARDKDKVFNPNFVDYDELSQETKLSNELAVLSFIKGFSSYLGGLKGKTNYSELDVLKFIRACFEDLSGQEMMHVLHGNHMAWAVLAYVRESGNVSGDVSTEFHAQNPVDFYIKDLGTILPAMFHALSQLGQDPVQYHDKLDIEIWGAKDAAKYMKKFMPK